jgi:hypothetical protein
MFTNFQFQLMWTRCIMHPVCLWWGRRSGRPGLAWGVGEGEVCYRQTQPGTPVFRHLTWLGIPGFQPNSAWHSRISTWHDPTLPNFDRPGPTWEAREGEVYYRQTWPDFSPAASSTSLFPHPPKPSSQTQTYRERAMTGRIFQALPT